MKMTPCCQPPGDAFDGKPRVIVLKEDVVNLENAAACVVSHLSDIERAGGAAASAVALLKAELERAK